MSSLFKIIIYTTTQGKKPFTKWFETLDGPVQDIIDGRLSRISLGNFGDCKNIKKGNGINELRIPFGSGYRVYYGVSERVVVVLLIGGDKSGQNKDIEKAKKYWQDYKETKK